MAEAKKSGKKVVRGKKKAGVKTSWLVLGLIVVVFGGVLFVGATAGWFSGGSEKVRLSEEYYCEEECANLTSLSVAEYEDLVRGKKSFVLFIDQAGCTTAESMKQFLSAYMVEARVKVYRMTFGEMKTTELYPETVKYYPSVAVFREGKAVAALRADSDEDAGAYNNRAEFFEWMDKWVWR